MNVRCAVGYTIRKPVMKKQEFPEEHLSMICRTIGYALNVKQVRTNLRECRIIEKTTLLLEVTPVPANVAVTTPNKNLKITKQIRRITCNLLKS